MELDVRNQGKIPLIQHPDFSALGYEVIRELGRNQQGGRITYLASVRNFKQQVVIKEFSVSHAGADWLGITAYEREVQILQKLNHPRIPRYLDSFTTSKGFYIVEEYKNAPSLGSASRWHPEAIKQIAVSLLEILVYLQQRVDPIIHRDIKPENILVDEQLNAYLVDFDLAHIQGEKMALSSLVSGTPGFIPPEEHLGQTLTPASDLYSLGSTLIYLLAKTHAVNIRKLFDGNYRFDLQQFPAVNPCFVCWLRGMVEPKWQYRYPNAAAALAALRPIQVTGATSILENAIASLRLRRHTFILGLVIIGLLAAGGITLVISQQDSAAQQVQKVTGDR
ncbi:serine/threonine protein kinase [Nostoc sp. UHCC 0870]|uniref:serine/threonine protein kinase n=1 Tax=Nostoc sp. UHCC 0870 TaxID=2914041 RepID=UPI001EE09565|nr:serine/threonine-protein kinase [Nostoc sp. UHCC 0870]UKO98109.1 serine/threonine protein kinase [Nostoc sp. UHCC 0870]